MRILMTMVAAGLLAVVASGCSSNASPAPVQSYSRTILAVQHLRQEPMLCVPTSAAMVLAFYGDPRQPRLLKSLAAGRQYDPKAPFNDFTITSYADMVRAMRNLGYDWSQHTFSNDDTGFADGLGLIERELREGHPVLVDATMPSGHTFVIRGFDVDKRALYAVDPDEPAPGEREISFDEFESVWNEKAYGNDLRAMIVTRPNSSGTIIS